MKNRPIRRPIIIRPTVFIAALVIACSLGLAVAPAAAQEKVTNGPEQLKYEFVDLSIPEGRLAFTILNKNGSDIFVADFKKIEVSPLVTGPSTDEYPTWSPDGRKIAFYSDRDDGDREIYSISGTGADLTRLTKSKGADEDPNWSADGKKIVFSSARTGKGMNLFSMAPDGTGIEQYTDTPNNNTVPKWSPRGDEILYSTNAYWPGWDILLFELTGRSAKVMTRGYQSFCRGSWSPDGSQFVFSYGSAKDIDLWIQQKGESQPQELTTMDGREYDGIYIDKNRVLFVADDGGDAGKFQLWLINTESKKTIPILKISGSVRYISYTPFQSADAIAEDLVNNPAPAGDTVPAEGAGTPAASPAPVAGSPPAQAQPPPPPPAAATPAETTPR